MNNRFVIASVAKQSRWLLLWIASSLALLAMTGVAMAITVEDPLPDVAQEASARELFREFRCVVCQGESIADSPADVARDMRREIRGQMMDGKSAAEIRAYFVERYGDFVLMNPPLSKNTFLLWFGPLMILALAFGMAFFYFRKTGRHAE